MSIYSEDFLNRLKSLMKVEGLNKHQLAMQTGIPYPNIISLFSKNRDIKMTTAITLAKYFNCSLDFLFSDTNDPIVLEDKANLMFITKYYKASPKIQKAIDCLLID